MFSTFCSVVPSVSSGIPWIRRFGRLEYCSWQSTSSSSVWIFFLRKSGFSSLFVNCLVSESTFTVSESNLFARSWGKSTFWLAPGRRLRVRPGVTPVRRRRRQPRFGRNEEFLLISRHRNNPATRWVNRDCSSKATSLDNVHLHDLTL